MPPPRARGSRFSAAFCLTSRRDQYASQNKEQQDEGCANFTQRSVHFLEGSGPSAAATHRLVDHPTVWAHDPLPLDAATFETTAPNPRATTTYVAVDHSAVRPDRAHALGGASRLLD
jgi:hypothetical protein